MTIQATLPLPKVSKGSNQVGDQGQGVEVAKEKGKSKETKPPSEVEDAAKANEAVNEAKETETKTKKIDPKAKDTSASQPS